MLRFFAGEGRAPSAPAPTGRLGRPFDIDAIAAFLASAEAGWINGQVVLANNGGSG